MNNSDLPYTFKTPITEDAIKIMMVKLLGDFNIEIDGDKALKLFYSFFSHIIYHLDVNPGFYFKLRYIDITKDGKDFLCVKRSSEYTEDTMTPAIFFNKFSGPAFIRDELSNTIDLFAESFLALEEHKKKQEIVINELISIQKELAKEIKELSDNREKGSYRYLQKLEKKNKAQNLKQLILGILQHGYTNDNDINLIQAMEEANLKKEIIQAWKDGKTFEKI